MNYAVNSNSNFFQVFRLKFLESFFRIFFPICIQWNHQQMLSAFPSKYISNPSTNHPHRPYHNPSHHHSHLNYGNNLLTALSASAPVPHSHFSITMVWSYYDRNQIRSLLCSKSSSGSQLRVIAQAFPLAHHLLYNDSQWTHRPPLLTFSPLTLLQLSYLLYSF